MIGRLPLVRHRPAQEPCSRDLASTVRIFREKKANVGQAHDPRSTMPFSRERADSFQRIEVRPHSMHHQVVRAVGSAA